MKMKQSYIIAITNNVNCRNCNCGSHNVQLIIISCTTSICYSCFSIWTSLSFSFVIPVALSCPRPFIEKLFVLFCFLIAHVHIFITCDLCRHTPHLFYHNNFYLQLVPLINIKLSCILQATGSLSMKNSASSMFSGKKPI